MKVYVLTERWYSVKGGEVECPPQVFDSLEKAQTAMRNSTTSYDIEYEPYGYNESHDGLTSAYRRHTDDESYANWAIAEAEVN